MRLEEASRVLEEETSKLKMILKGEVTMKEKYKKESEEERSLSRLDYMLINGAHSLTHSLIHSFTHMTHSLIHSFTHMTHSLLTVPQHH